MSNDLHDLVDSLRTENARLRREAEAAKQETADHAARLRREWVACGADELLKQFAASNAELEKARDEALARVAELEREMGAVADYLKPNWSNDMPWSDEIIIAADQHALSNGPAWIAAEVEKGMKAVRDRWGNYKAFLMAKYPAPEGQAWAFTCPHHQAIDDLLGNPPAIAHISGHATRAKPAGPFL